MRLGKASKIECKTCGATAFQVAHTEISSLLLLRRHSCWEVLKLVQRIRTDPPNAASLRHLFIKGLTSAQAKKDCWREAVNPEATLLHRCFDLAKTDETITRMAAVGPPPVAAPSLQAAALTTAPAPPPAAPAAPPSPQCSS